MNSFKVGMEAQLIDEIKARMAAMSVQEIPQEPLSRTLTSRIIARRFVASRRKDPARLFSALACGNAPKLVCDDAYRFTVKLLGKGRLPADCSLPMTRERAESAGFPGWEKSFEPAAQKGWLNLCRRQKNKNHRSPDQSASGSAGFHQPR
jgi:hypothetical protein